MLPATRLNNSRKKSRHKGLLEGAQLRFAFCCALIHNLKKYRETQLEEHYNDVPKYWDRLTNSIATFLNPNQRFPVILNETYRVKSVTLEEQQQELVRAGILYQSGRVRQKAYTYFPQIDTLQLSCPWFCLSEPTDRIVRGFDYLPDKLGNRIVAKKDLKDVIAILEDLARYLFSIIPTLPSDEDGESDEIRESGLNALTTFADKMIEIVDYRPEPTPLSARQISFGERVTNCLTVAGKPFSSSNLLLRFLSWWVLLQLIVIGCLRFWLHFYPLKMDSTILVAVVGSPLVVAVTALGITRVSRSE
jgi:hypothetical protein